MRSSKNFLQHQGGLKGKMKLQAIKSDLYFNKISGVVSKLQCLMNQIEEGRELDDAFNETFKETAVELRHSVDDRICAFDTLDSVITRFKDIEATYRSQRQSLERIRDKLTERTVELIRADSELPFNGSVERLAAQRQKSSVVTDFVTRQVSISNVVEPNTVPLAYLETRTYYIFKREEARLALERGEVVPGCKLEENYSLRRRGRSDV